MAYELRTLRRQKVRYNSANADYPLKWSLVLNGEKFVAAAIDACTIAIYKPGTATAVLAATAATVTVGSSLITYAVDTTTVANFPVGTGYRADVVFTDDSASKSYYGHFVFDVVTRPLIWLITRDQLVDRDYTIKSMEWGGDSDFSGPIESARDDCQLALESLAHETGQVLEDMALDHHKLAAVCVYHVLELLFRPNVPDKADHYANRLKMLWDQYKAQVHFDTSQSGEEDATTTSKRRVRLVT